MIAIDFGYSEVMTDSNGEQYGPQFGEILTSASDTLKVKMQNRSKLHALQKKYAASPSKAKKVKAKNILKNNLGRIKLDRKHQKLKATLSREINTAFNKLIKKKNTTLISESLSHQFDYNRGRTWNRRLSAWVKGVLVERLEFKALAKGFSHYQVNPAYTSQTCLFCGYVDHKNRKGDKFQCLYCRYENHADWVAAMNLRSRYFDREITRYTPYREVKKILQTRFQRRLETKTAVWASDDDGSAGLFGNIDGCPATWCRRIIDDGMRDCRQGCGRGLGRHWGMSPGLIMLGYLNSVK